MQNWSCDQIDNFEKLQYAYLSSCYFFKGIQAFIFVALSVYIINKLCKGASEVGAPALTMSLLAAFNGIFAIIRVEASFPVF